MQALLSLCIATGDDREDDRLTAAASTIVQWMEDPANDRTLIPHPALLVWGLRATSIKLPTASHRRLEAAALREERRSAIAAEQVERLTALLRREAIDHHPLRGWHFAKLYYPDPLARHCHALRWLVQDGPTLESLVKLLAGEGWTIQLRSPLQSPHKIILAGQDRIHVEFHRKLFPWIDRPQGECAPLGPELVAIELIGAALIEPQARSGLWLVDLVQLLRAERVDPARFAGIARDCGIAGAACRALHQIVDLANPATTELLDPVRQLRDALTGNSGERPRDARRVTDLLTVQAMADSSRKRFLLKAVRRPDLFSRGYALRKDRVLTRLQAAESRQMLRDYHESNRP
jgi:putative nucleotidyltransferase-like protein